MKWNFNLTMKHSDGPKTTDEEALHEATEIMATAVHALGKLQGHVALTGFERDVMDDLEGDMQEMLTQVENRKELCNINFEEVVSQFSTVMDALATIEKQLPSETEADEIQNEDVFQLVQNTVDMKEQTHELRAIANDYSEE